MITYFIISSLQRIISQETFFWLLLWGAGRLVKSIYFLQRLFAHDRHLGEKNGICWWLVLCLSSESGLRSSRSGNGTLLEQCKGWQLLTGHCWAAEHSEHG